MAKIGLRNNRVLAIASGGGHWVQLLRLRPAFEDSEVHYVTTLAGSDAMAPGERITVVRDASRTDILGLVVLAVQLLFLILRHRPGVIVSTGAAPGVLALRMGKFLGARTVWIDSFANVDEVSMSGLLARRYADLWLTQWPHLVPKHFGLTFAGGVL